MERASAREKIKKRNFIKTRQNSREPDSVINSIIPSMELKIIFHHVFYN